MRRVLRRLLALFGARTAGGRWGKSPRLSPDELPDWAQEFQASGWAATPNPQAERSRQQRRVRLLMWLMVSALPVSLLSCLFSLAPRGGPSSSPAATGSDASASRQALPKAQARALVLAKRWLDGGGLEYEAITWQGYSESFLPCAGQPASECETHTFKTRLVNWGWEPGTGKSVFRQLLDGDDGGKRVQLADGTWVRVADFVRVDDGTADNQVEDGTWVRVAVTLDPLTGTAAGISIAVEDASGQNLSNSQPVWDDDVKDEMPEESQNRIGETIREWAQAWATGNQVELHRLHGHDASTLSGEDAPAPSYPWFGLTGWTVADPEDPDSLEVLAILGDHQNYLATAAFSVYQQCVEQVSDVIANSGVTALCNDCSDAASSQRCDGDLGVVMDLKLEVVPRELEDDLIVVKEYGAVGTLSPPEPVDENPA